MSGPPDRDRRFPKPFLIEPDGEGAFRLILRQGHYNSQHFPIVTTTVIDERFSTSGAARAYAKSNFAAGVGDISLPRRETK